MEYLLRKETEADWHDAEWVTKKAFWNLHVPGCNEHLLVHKLRQDPSYVPELTRVAEIGGRIVGAIYYAVGRVQDGDRRTEMLTFGPLCVDPEFQRMGIGGALLDTTLGLAAQLGWKAVIIYGEPDYYPRHGFCPCERFGITTPEGENFPAFMAKELLPCGLEGVHGQFYDPPVYFDLPQEELEEFDKGFPYMEKLHLPGQWV